MVDWQMREEEGERGRGTHGHVGGGRNMKGKVVLVCVWMGSEQGKREGEGSERKRELGEKGGRGGEGREGAHACVRGLAECIV